MGALRSFQAACRSTWAQSALHRPPSLRLIQCCRPVPNVYHYFERACRRDPAPLNGSQGGKVVDEDGNSVVFWVETEGNRIVGAAYRCTTCFTLIALCEHLSEILGGMDLETARRYTAADLLGLHPEIPPSRRNRAELAVAALRSALAEAEKNNGVLV